MPSLVQQIWEIPGEYLLIDVSMTSVRRKDVLTNMAAKTGAVCVLKNHFLLFGFGLVWGISPPGNSITPESLSQALLAI